MCRYIIRRHRERARAHDEPRPEELLALQGPVAPGGEALQRRQLPHELLPTSLQLVHSCRHASDAPKRGGRCS